MCTIKKKQLLTKTASWFKNPRLTFFLFVSYVCESAEKSLLRLFCIARKIRMLTALAHAKINTFFQIYNLDCFAEKWNSATTETYQRSSFDMKNFHNGNAVVALVTTFGHFFGSAKWHFFVATAQAHRKTHHMNCSDLKLLAMLNFLRKTLRIRWCVYFFPSAKRTE